MEAAHSDAEYAPIDIGPVGQVSMIKGASKMSSTRSASTRASSRRAYRVNKVVRRQRITQQTRFNSRRNSSLAKRRAQGQYPRIRHHSPDLKDALQDLEEVSVAAQEQEIQQPSEIAFASARRLIHEMYSISPRPLHSISNAGGLHCYRWPQWKRSSRDGDVWARWRCPMHRHHRW